MKRYAIMKDPKGYFKPEDIHPIIENSPHPYKLLFLVAWNTGRRISEIVRSPDIFNSTGIRRIDIDRFNNRIRFITLKTRDTDPNDSLMWVDGIDENIIDSLWKQSNDMKETDPVFGCINRSTATMRFQRICHKNGIYQIGSTKPHMHHFRHSAIMYMYAKGLRPEEIQLRTGHRDINSLLYYIKIMEIENLTEKFKELWKDESQWVEGVLNE